MINQHTTKKVWTVDEIARLKRVSLNTVYRWIRDGHLVAEQGPGKRGPIRIADEQLSRFNAQCVDRAIGVID